MQTQSNITSPTNPAVVAASANNEDFQTTGPTSQEVAHQQAAKVAPEATPVREWPFVIVDGEGQKLPLHRINKGRNPRTYFDPTEMAELTTSVKENGILQAILVRLVGDVYQIVAGERRWRAAEAAFGPDFLMPVLIKEMTDAEADAYATIENTHRADMSPMEEAQAASVEVGRVKGDREEAARVLGWSRSKLDKRLGLMNCEQSVRTALTERVITLGHAELLAALSKANQEKLLPVIIQEKKTVAEVKGTIESIASKLDVAIFNKAECSGCQHNSTQQASMFEQSITDGSCTNSGCYKKKTEEELQLRSDALKDDYPVIRILRIGDNSTRVKLVGEGEKGVGNEQAQACRGCANFGAAVSGLPQALGQVYKDQCFDPACNATKVTARLKAEADSKQEDRKQQSAANAGTTGTSTSGPKAAPTEEKTAPAVATEVHASERIKEYRVKVWRKAMRTEISNSAEISVQYLLALCLNGAGRNINSSTLAKAFGKLGGSSAGSTTGLDNCAQAVAQAGPEVAQTMMTLLAASAMDNLDEHKLQELARHHQLDLRKHWKLDAAFLELMTKSEIEFLAKQVGLDTAFGAPFKKLFSEKKPDLIKALLALDNFDYSATIPAVLAY